MPLIALAQILALVLSASLALGIYRRIRATRARRAAAFEAFALGHGLQLYRIAGAAPVYRMADAAGTVVTLEAPAEPLLPFRAPKTPGAVTVALPGPRLGRGFVAVVAGVAAGVPDRGRRLDRALRGVARSTDPVALRVLPLGDAVALLADVPPGATPDLEAIRAALAEPALRPGDGGTAMIALNPEGLHLRLGRRIGDPAELGAILDEMQRLRAGLQGADRRRAA